MIGKKEAADILIAAMQKRPDDFYMGQYHMTDAKTKNVYWIANSAYGFGLTHPHSLKFGWWQSRRIWRTIEGLKAYKMLQKEAA